MEGLAEVPVTNVEDLLRLMHAGNEGRHVAATKMNDVSSRSHAVFTIQLIQKRRSVTKSGAAKVTELRAKMNLVDLAGSERVKSTGAEGETLKEGAQINKSLSTLGLVINALAENSKLAGTAKKHIPYRDSTLTFLLKESLGGNSKTMMLSTLSPSTNHYDETLSTLRYADRAKAIVTRAFVNETAGDKRIRELEEEVARLREFIRALRDRAPATLVNVLSGAAGLAGQSTQSHSTAGGAPNDDDDNDDDDDLPDTFRETSHNGGDQNENGDDDDGVVARTLGFSPEARRPHTRDDDNGSVASQQPANVLSTESTHEQKDDTAAEDDSDDKVLEDERSGQAGFSPSVSPTSEQPSSAMADVEALQAQLERAEEIIRQSTATDADRAKEAAEVLDAFKAQPLVGVNRSDPYLLNLEGVGEWLIAHVSCGQTYIGATGGSFPAPFHNGRRSRRQSTTAFTGDNVPTAHNGGSLAGSAIDLSSLEDFIDGSSDVSEAEVPSAGRVAAATGQPGIDRHYIAVPAELSCGIGSPHCLLTLPPNGAARVKPLDGCLVFLNDLSEPLRDEVALHSGDVLTLAANAAEEGIQFKFVDPSAPLASTRSRALPVVSRSVPRSDGLLQPQQQPQQGQEVADPALREESPSQQFALSVEAQQEVGSRPQQPSPLPRRSDDDNVSPVVVPGLVLGALTRGFVPAREEDDGALPQRSESERTPAADTTITESEGSEAEPVSLPTPLGTASTSVATPSSSYVTEFATVSHSATDVGHSLPSGVSGAKKAVPRGPMDTDELTTVHGAPPLSSAAFGSDRQPRRSNGFTATDASTTAHRDPTCHFVGRHSFLFLGPAGSGKTHTRDNLRQPDRWFAFLSEPFKASPTFGVDHNIVEVIEGSGTFGATGSDDLQLHFLELGGTSCFSALLLPWLPTRRVTYVVCFSLHQQPTLQTLQETLECVLCHADHRDVGVVLLGTHLDRARLPQSRLYRLLDDLEQQVQSYLQLLQPAAALRPSIIGRFAVDNIGRRVVSSVYTKVSTFPQLLRWMSERAMQRCRTDEDYLNGHIPRRCVELGKLIDNLRHTGKWCLTLSDYKAMARALDVRYAAHLSELHRDTQLLGSWGALLHLYQHAVLRQFVFVDVPWTLNLLAAVASCGPVRQRENVGRLRERRRSELILANNKGYLNTFESLAVPYDVSKVLAADSFGLLADGLITTKVLHVLTQRLVQSTDRSPPRMPLDGLITFLVSCDWIIRGSRLRYSGRLSPSEPLLPSVASETDALHGRFESVLLLPSNFAGVPSAAVIEHVPKLLNGPFYRFTLSVVPGNFFGRLLSRVAQAEETAWLYLGPVCRRVVPTVDNTFPVAMEVENEELPSAAWSVFPSSTTVPADGTVLWGTTAWVASRGGESDRAGGTRALLRLVHHSLFITFHTSERGSETDDVFHESVLGLARDVIRESPGVRCEESLLCSREYYNGTHGLLRVVQSSTTSAVVTEEDYTYFHPVDDNLNSLEKIRAREQEALRTARSHRSAYGTAGSSSGGGASYPLPTAVAPNSKGIGVAGEKKEEEEEPADLVPFVRRQREPIRWEALRQLLMDSAAASASGERSTEESDTTGGLAVVRDVVDRLNTAIGAAENPFSREDDRMHETDPQVSSAAESEAAVLDELVDVLSWM